MEEELAKLKGQQVPIKTTTGGRILDVQAASQDGVTVHVVKVLLPDGRVREVTVRSK